MHRYRNINLFQWSRYESIVSSKDANDGDGWFQTAIEAYFPISYSIAYTYISSVVNGGTAYQWVSFTNSNMIFTNRISSLVHSIYNPDNELSITYLSIGI